MGNKFNVELPADSLGQKTTAVPVAGSIVPEWYTPVKDINVAEKLASIEAKLNELLSKPSKAHPCKEPFLGSSNVTHTFGQMIQGFVISNDAETDLTFTINSYTFIVKAGEVFEEWFDPFNVVTIVASGNFRAYGRL